MENTPQPHFSITHFLTGISVILLLQTVNGLTQCPLECRCSIDTRGRSTVTCKRGGLREMPPVNFMAENTKVLVVSASRENPNYISLGPIFRGLGNLEQIEITNSGIPSLGEHSFWGLHFLEILNLSRNSLTELRDTNLRGAHSLKSLDLSHNRIESIPSAAFRHVRQLTHLRLAYNSVRELVPRIFFGISRLEYLDLSHNPLKQLHADIFADTPYLKTLKCAACDLHSFSNLLIGTLKDLREIDLQNNKLIRIPDQLYLAPHLTTLQLNGNRISVIERGTFFNSRLTHLHIAHNSIITVESEAFINSSLLHFDLSYNRLNSFGPEGFVEILNRLRVLKLSGNSIDVRELARILDEARNLHQLGLGDIGLTLIPPDLLYHGNSIRHLNISANYLSNLPLELFTTCPNLQVLDLSLNNFRGVSKVLLEAISEAKYLRVLKLERNPWLCDQCHVSDLIKWLHDAPDQESGCLEPRVWTCLKCAGPASFVDRELALLPPGDLPSCTPTSTELTNVYNGNPTVSIASLAHQPLYPRGELTRQITDGSETRHVVEIFPPWTLKDLLKERVYTIVIATGIFITCLLILIIVAIIAYHKQRAYYYTRESQLARRQYVDEVLSDSPRNRNNNNKIPNKQKKVSIATIEEVQDIAGSTEIIDTQTKDKEKSCRYFRSKEKKNLKEIKTNVSPSTREAYQTVVDELGRTKLCKEPETLIQILDSEPRPGKG